MQIARPIGGRRKNSLSPFPIFARAYVYARRAQESRGPAARRESISARAGGFFAEKRIISVGAGIPAEMNGWPRPGARGRREPRGRYE